MAVPRERAHPGSAGRVLFARRLPVLQKVVGMGDEDHAGDF